LQALTEYFQAIHNVKILGGSLMQKREEQIRQSARREMRGELEHRFHDKMGRYTQARERRQHASDRSRRDDNKKRVASSTSNRGRYDTNCHPKKDSCGNRKSPPEQKDKDFKPCHLHGKGCKHSYNECSRNPKTQKQ
jgi:hypothetical protein